MCGTSTGIATVELLPSISLYARSLILFRAGVSSLELIDSLLQTFGIASLGNLDSVVKTTDGDGLTILSQLLGLFDELQLVRGEELIATVVHGVCHINLSAFSVRVIEVEYNALCGVDVLQRQRAAVGSTLCRELTTLEADLIAVNLDLGHLDERQCFVLGLIVTNTVDDHVVNLLALVDGKLSRVCVR